jgi:hypothetical protein
VEKAGIRNENKNTWWRGGSVDRNSCKEDEMING